MMTYINISGFDNHTYNIETINMPRSNVTENTDNYSDSGSMTPFHWEQYPPVPYGYHAFVGVIMIIILLVASIGNGLVIYVYWKFKSLRSPTNLLLVNLALSDLLMAVTGFPVFIIGSFQGEWVLGQIECNIYGATGATFGLMSINNMAAIAIDRYLVISRGYKIRYKTSILFIMLIWLYSILWALPPLFGWSRYSLEGFETTCSYDFFSRTNTSDKYFLLAVFIGDYVIPFCIICGCYSAILLQYRAHKKEFQAILDGASNEGKPSKSNNKFSQNYALIKTLNDGKVVKKTIWRKTEYKIAKTVCLIVVVYVMSWTPYATIALIGQYGNLKLVTPMVSMIPIIVAKLSTIYNPFIYAISHPRFKSALKKTFPSLFTRKVSAYFVAKFRNISLKKSYSMSKGIDTNDNSMEFTSDYKDIYYCSEVESETDKNVSFDGMKMTLTQNDSKAVMI